MFEAVRRDATGPRVALKRVLAAHANEPDYARMFADEIRIASRIRDENVLAVIDACVDPPTQYLALEYIDGVDASAFEHAARSGDLTLTQSAIAYIGAAVARGLFAAHCAVDERGRRLNVVHRDVSPGNVFVTRDGAVKLGDFGVAYASDRATRTVTGVVKGKLSFMAPEQLAGVDVDPRADVFSLGCTLHAIAVGASPFKSMEQLSSLLKGAALPLSDEIPDDLRAVLARALAALPSERFDDARALADALSALVVDVDAARSELVAAVAACVDREPSKPRFDALWSLEEPSPSSAELLATEGAPPPTVATRREVVRHDSRESSRDAPRSRAPMVWRIGALFSVCLAGVFVYALIDRRVTSADRVRTNPLPHDVTPAIVDATSFVAHDAHALAVVPSASPDERPDVATRERPTHPRVVATRVAATVVEAGAPATSVDPVVAPTGWIRVGFEGDSANPMSGTRVLVDGVDRGWAPARVSVLIGSHRVVVRAADGRALFDDRVQVGEEHTRLSPRAVLVRGM